MLCTTSNGMEILKIFVLGASGFLGSRFIAHMAHKKTELITNRVEITDYSKLLDSFKKHKPDVVINFAGVRAYPTIDWCEDNKKETVAVNVNGAINVMLAALEVDAYPIQISSGCVYSGGPEHAFTEEDAPNFEGSFYSRMRIVLQKALAELPILYTRIRLPVSCYYHPRNTLTKIISYKQVISIPNSVTLVEDLMPALEKLIQVRPTGILNLTNEGYVEHKDLLEAYKKYANPNHNYSLITLEELENQIVKAKRSNCILSVTKARSLGVNMPALNKERLKEIMIKYKKSL